MSAAVSLLVVDDEPLIRLVMQEALEAGGFEVKLAASGDDAIRLLTEQDLQIAGLVTDIRLGAGADGWGVAHRARELNASICVVYVTGDSAADWPAHGVPNSIVLQKPFADAQLLTAISTLLNEQGSAAQNPC